MQGRFLLLSVGILATVVFVGCEEGSPLGTNATADDVVEVSPSSAAPTPTPTPTVRESWRKARFISAAEAVERLQAHVDVPVVVPSPTSPLLGRLKGWLADPKYLSWEVREGERVGRMQLVKRKRTLVIDYGYATFDGCAGRDFGIETNVLGQPALLKQFPRGVWSALVWPVTPDGWTGHYGLYGNFEGWELVLLAESMESALLEATDHTEGC